MGFKTFSEIYAIYKEKSVVVSILTMSFVWGGWVNPVEGGWVNQVGGGGGGGGWVNPL